MKHLRNIALIAATCATMFAQLASTSLKKTVTTAGTAVQLASTSTTFVSGTIQALVSNTGKVCLGASNALASTNTGICISAGQAVPLYAVPGVPHDLSAWWIDSAVNGEGVSVTYEK